MESSETEGKIGTFSKIGKRFLGAPQSNLSSCDTKNLVVILSHVWAPLITRSNKLGDRQDLQSHKTACAGMPEQRSYGELMLLEWQRNWCEDARSPKQMSQSLPVARPCLFRAVSYIIKITLSEVKMTLSASKGNLSLLPGFPACMVLHQRQDKHRSDKTTIGNHWHGRQQLPVLLTWFPSQQVALSWTNAGKWIRVTNIPIRANEANDKVLGGISCGLQCIHDYTYERYIYTSYIIIL